MKSVKADILNTIQNSESKFSFMDIVRKVSRTGKISVKEAKTLVHEMIDQGELEYVTELGHTFVVPAFNRPVRVSARIILQPPEMAPSPEQPEDVVIKLKKSTSFGRGDHPTTRLSLMAIETAVGDGRINNGMCLDVGCGTGVLCIAAVMLGMTRGFGVDIDPLAVYDAWQNARLNGVENRTRFSRTWPGETGFHLICANLRTPSLVKLKEAFREGIDGKGRLVLSGFKTDEVDCLAEKYAPLFRVVKKWQENSWCAILLEPLSG